MRLKLQIILGILLIGLTIGFSVWNLNRSGFFNLTNTDVIVENFADQKNYLAPLIAQVNTSMTPYMGQSLWSISPEKVAQSVESLPWVQEVRVSVRWPVSLRIQIVAKEVALLLVHHNGTLMPVTKEGELLPPVSANHSPSVVLLQGEVFEKQKEQRQKAIEVIQSIPAQGNFSQKNISEIHYDTQEGFWIHLVGSGLRVNLGQDQVMTKSLRVSQVLNYLDEHQMDARVIDANLSKKVLVRLRKGP